MTEQADKLRTIRTLPASQLRGWYALITSGFCGQYQAPFPGEIAACADRARVLGIDLSETVE